MNLELNGCSTPTADLPNNGCPSGGCDFVAIYDGQHNTDPLLGKFSGFLQGAALPEVVSSGEWLRVEFHTDTGNCGIDAAEDPGWEAHWDFVENGQDICEPDSAVLRTVKGVLHDDDVVNVGSGSQTYENPGYGDNLDCGVRIRAPQHGTVNLHVVQMNLETNFDYLKVYDGRNADAPLLASLTGQPTDQVLTQDSYTSTGRDMFVQFTTDVHNGQLELGGEPGFYAEWELLDDGADCITYTETASKALVGHNSEQLTSVTVEQCEQACCARSWCESFDFIREDNVNGAPNTGTVGHCNLADVSASQHHAALTTNNYWSYFERPISSIPVMNPALGASGCQQRLDSISQVVTDECCSDEGCDGGVVPPVCSEQCAANWMPFSKQCSVWLEDEELQLEAVTDNCEREMYGRYHEGSNHGRCSDGDIDQYESEVAAACCGDNGIYCPGAAVDTNTDMLVSSWDLLPPTDSSGQPICTPECRTFFEEVYAECHPRFDDTDTGATASAFLAICQEYSVGRGGNRRQLDTIGENRNDNVVRSSKSSNKPVVRRGTSEPDGSKPTSYEPVEI